MSTILSEIEIRVLGSLVEKQVTTPEYYPLTLNALTVACNQKNNRHPVTSYDEPAVASALEGLREKNLVYVFYGSTSRVPKYKHVMTEVMHLSVSQLAIMCVLMLRGSQTLGEIRERAGRLHEFSTIEEVETTLDTLSVREPESLVARLPRQQGQKEARYSHLLRGEISFEPTESNELPKRNLRSQGHDNERILELEQDLKMLRDDVKALQVQFEEFKRQFE